MKQLWREDKANFKGDHFRLNNAMISPKPIQKPNPPIYIACNTSRRLMPRLAAKHGEGLAVMWGHDPTVAITIKAFQEEWKANRRDPDAFSAIRSSNIIFCNHEDPIRANRFRSEISGFPLDMTQMASPAKVPEGATPNLNIIGKPSTVVEEIERRVFGMGFNQIMCSFVVCEDMQIDTDGLPGWAGNYLGGLRLFVDDVLPKLSRS